MSETAAHRRKPHICDPTRQCHGSAHPRADLLSIKEHADTIREGPGARTRRSRPSAATSAPGDGPRPLPTLESVRGGIRPFASPGDQASCPPRTPGARYTAAPFQQRCHMITGKRVCVVMPAYNAGKTLAQTVAEIDRTRRRRRDRRRRREPRRHRAGRARSSGSTPSSTRRNRGYGGNQKTCYTEALARGADIVVMVHPDYQYSPRLMPAMAVDDRERPLRLRARLAHPRRSARCAGGMPLWKYVANRLADRAREPAARLQALRVPHRLPRLLAAGSWRRCRWRRTPTTSCSTTRSSRRASGSGSTSAR